MNGSDAVAATLMQGKALNPNGGNLSFDLIADQLMLFARYLKRQGGSAGMGMGQPFRGDGAPLNVLDPMALFVSGFGAGT